MAKRISSILVVLVFGVFISASANAALIDTIVLDNPGESYTNFSQGVAGDAQIFPHDYELQLGQGLEIGTTVFAFNFGATGITNIMLVILDASENPLVPAQTAGNGELLTVALNNVGGGTDYIIRITGTLLGETGLYSLGVEALSAVPLPPALLLFLSGLVGLAVVGRKKLKAA